METSSNSKSFILENQGNFLRTMFEEISNPIIVLKGNRIMNGNKSAEGLFLVQKDGFEDVAFLNYSPVVQPDGQYSSEKYDLCIKEVLLKKSIIVKWQFKKKDDILFMSEITMSLFIFENENYITAVIRNIYRTHNEQEESKYYLLSLEQLALDKTLKLQEFIEQLQSSNEELKLSNLSLEHVIEQHIHTQADNKILEEKLKMFISNSGDGIQIINEDGFIEEWNGSMFEITGVKRDEAIGCYIWDIEFSLLVKDNQTIETYEKIKNSCLQYIVNIHNEKNLILEGTFVHKTLGERLVQTTIFPIIIESGNFIGRITRDITQRKITETKLEQYKTELENLLAINSQELFQLSDRFNEVYKNSTDAIIFMDIAENGETLTLFDANRKALDYFEDNSIPIFRGVPIEKLITTKQLHENFQKDVLPKILSGETVVSDESERINNHQAYWQTTYIPIRNSVGDVYRYASFTKDMTAEIENKKNWAILTTAIENWPYDFWVFDKKGVVNIQNNTSYKNWGNYKGKHYREIKFPETNRGKIFENFKAALEGKSVNLDITLQTKWQKKALQMHLNPIILPNGQLNGFVNIVIDVTARKEAEAALVKSELKYRELVDHANSIILRCNPKGIITYLNDYGQRFFGYAESEILGQAIVGTIVPEFDDHGQSLQTLLNDMISNPTQYVRTVYQNICRDGRKVWINWTNKILYDEKGKIRELFSIGSDITEQKNIEEALTLSEKKYSTIFKASPIPLTVSELDTGRFIDVNEAFLKLVNAGSFDQILGRTSIELGIVKFDDRKKIMPIIQNKNHIEKFELKLTRLDGKSLTVDCNSVTYEFEGKMHVLIHHFDITSKKQAELMLKESEEKYRTAFSTSRDAITITKLNGVYVNINEAFTRLSGYSLDEVINVTTFDLNIWNVPEDRTRFLNAILKDGWIENIETGIRYKNGSVRTVLISGSLITINGEQHVMSVARDISESRELQKALVLNEQKFRAIFNSSKDSIVVINKDLNIIDINDSFITLSHVTRRELIGMNIKNLVDYDNSAELMSKIEKFWQGLLIHNFETEIRKNHHENYSVEISANNIKLDSQDALLLVIRDISDRKKLEKELLNSVIKTEEQERLYFSQELHDGLGPTISAAKMYTQWLLKPNANINRVEVVTDIEKLLEEAGRTIRDISFKLNPHILQNYGVVEAIKAFAEKVGNPSELSIEVQSLRPFKLHEITETIIYRVLCECINNTIKHAHATKIGITFDYKTSYLSVRYTDNGNGFDVEKVITSRKGIGLLNMQSRLKSINGQFSIQSAPGENTVIFIQV